MYHGGFSSSYTCNYGIYAARGSCSLYLGIRGRGRPRTYPPTLIPTVMVMYDYDSNTILAKPIKNRQATTNRDAFLKIHNILKTRGSDPKV